MINLKDLLFLSHKVLFLCIVSFCCGLEIVTKREKFPEIKSFGIEQLPSDVNLIETLIFFGDSNLSITGWVLLAPRLASILSVLTIFQFLCQPSGETKTEIQTFILNVTKCIIRLRN